MLPRLSLLVRFSLLAFLCVAGLGVALFVMLRGDLRERTLAEARAQAEHLAAGVAVDLLTAEELNEGLDLRTLVAMDRAVEGHRVAGGLVTAKVFDRDGRLAYSPERDRIGEDGGDHVREALEGRVLAELEADSDHVAELGGGLYEVYVPLRFESGSPPGGVFEIYLPYAPVAERIATETRELIPVLGGGLAALYLLLLPIVARASRTLRRQAEESHHQALHDDLTGVANRRRLLARLEFEIHRGQPFVLLMLDLDRFKEVNDALGHNHGDRLLCDVAARLRGTVRQGDLLARLGGDEFALLVAGADSPAAGIEVAERISKLLHDDFAVGGVPLYVEASIGVAVHPEHGRTADALLQAADIAMYAAKRSGTSCEAYAPEGDRPGPDQVARLGELRRAIDQGELLLHYQPKLDLRSDRVSGVEALVRWDHPQQGLIPPGEFLPLAEHTGLIVPLTTWVLDTALQQCRAWSDVGIELPVAVNVSERSLVDPDFPDYVAGLLARWELGGERLQLELTERSLIGDLGVANGVVEGLHALGVSISVDDFGTGYSSLSRLRDLPINELKIDRSFVTDLDEDGQGAAIVRSVIDLGHHLGLEVVAEGVETADTLLELRELGCDAAQGYVLLRPMPAEDITRWLLGGDRADGLQSTLS
jgi:diguanylate cyclase (GGDEF)-like protein